MAAASRTGPAHLVDVLIVGIGHIASWGYPKAKLQAEQIVANSGLPWTILGVTQFYDDCPFRVRAPVRPRNHDAVSARGDRGRADGDG